VPHIGIDLGGTKLASAVFAADGDIMHRESVPLASRAGDEVGALIVEQIRALRERAQTMSARPTRLRRRVPAKRAAAQPAAAVGVAIPGIYRAATGTVWAPNIPGWDDYPLLDELRASVGPDTHVAIDSDRAAYILGETWRGGARGARDAVFIAVGTGIGVGILVDGRVVRGHAGIAGAVGWLALDRPYRPEYAWCGCFEHHASGPGLVKVARELMEQDSAYAGELRRKTASADEITTADLFAAYERRDTIATRVIDDAIELWGMAAANLVSVFDPEIVVFGGGVFGPALRFLDRIHAVAIRWGQPISMQRVIFAASTLGGDAGLYGAGRLALMTGDSR
jgi:glucokinase